MHTPQNPLSDDLTQAAKALNHWRNLRPNRQAPLPHALRRQILALADRYPIARLVKALRINHSMFKRWQQQEAETLSSDFIELATPSETPIHATPLSFKVRHPAHTWLHIEGTFTASQLQTVMAALMHHNTAPVMETTR